MLDIITFSPQSTLEKDLEIMVLRQQLAYCNKDLTPPFSTVEL